MRSGVHPFYTNLQVIREFISSPSPENRARTSIFRDQNCTPYEKA